MRPSNSRTTLFAVARLVVLSAALLLGGCSAVPPLQSPATSTTGPHQGGLLRYGLTLPVSGIDPHVHASSELGIVLSSVYDTLVVQDEGGAFHPHLATEWSMDDEGRVYTFKLRQDVVFHDGTPFNAAAVVSNLDRIANPATLSQKAIFMLGPYESAEAVDEYTVKINLREPYAPLLDSLSQVYLGMASPAALDQWGDQYQLHQVGTGPFRFVSYEERQRLVLERNPDYAWAPETAGHDGAAYLDGVEFRFYADPATRLPALLSSQTDVIGELPPRDAQQLGEMPDYTLYPVPVPGMSVQFFLNTQVPPLDDLGLRQALLHGTDRQALVQAVFGPASPAAYGPLSAVTLGADPSLADLYPYDVERARDLLAEAGWTDATGDGILDKSGEPLVLRGILQTWGELQSVGTVLQAQWQELGINLQLESMSYPAALEAARSDRYHLMPAVISGTDPSVLRTFFHSDNLESFDYSGVSDPEIDAALDAAARESDRSRRIELYAQVQRKVMEQAWILPIRDPVNLNAASTRVQGLTFDVQGWFPVLYDVWLE